MLKISLTSDWLKDNNQNQLALCINHFISMQQLRGNLQIDVQLTLLINNNLINQSALPMAEIQSLDEFKSHLNLIKSMTGDKAEEQFYLLMEKAKNTFGQVNIYMGEFYFQYARFLLEKMEKNIDVFNSNMLPNQNQPVEQNQLEEVIEDDSSLQNNSDRAKSQNNINATNVKLQKNSQQKKVENGDQPNDQPQITENLNENQENNSSIKKEERKQQQKDGEAEGAGQDDDFEVCADNLLCAIKIFQTERDRLREGGQQSKYNLPQVSKWISRCKSRLGDLYHLGQNYQEAVSVYRDVVEEEQKKEGHQSNRGLAQIHYMIANSFLYENKEGCQKIAIQQFIKSVQILLRHLREVNPQDLTVYEAPTELKVKVDRFVYLPKSTDNEEVKEIKEVISCLLDKIQDTFEQIAIRAQYEAEKRKTKKEQEENQFKQVSPNVPVIKLGTFGNRKKKAQELPDEELKKR